MVEFEGAHATQGLKVLVVEDEPNLRELLIRAIPDMGFQVGGVRTAEEGRDVMKESPAEIVFLDINLPGMSGLDFLPIIKENWPTTVVIIMTGYGDLEMAQTAIRYGVSDFLTKPAGLGDIEEALDRARRKINKTVDPETIQNFKEAEAQEVKEEEAAMQAPITLADLEKRHIIKALERHDGNRQAAAEELGISVRKLYYRLDEYKEGEV